MSSYDLAIKNGLLVIPCSGVRRADLGVKNEKIVTIADDIPAEAAERVIDASGKHVFPGAVDSHSHIGIYRPLDEDAASESAACAAGGVTTIASYFRTGKNYLNKTGSFRDIFPELLKLSENSFRVDYAYHIACMSTEQISEVEWLAKEGGVSTFKYYMFYKSLDLSGAEPSAGYLMLSKDTLDFGFLYRFMKEISRVNQSMEGSPLSLSIHCENPEVIVATVEEAKQNPTGNTMKDYSNGRPPWQEALAIKEVTFLAERTGCPVNLLHLSSRDAVEATMGARIDYPTIPFLAEATLHHLAMTNDNDYGILGKVNPPVRDQSHVDFLWESVLAGTIQTVASDHACHPKELRKGDLWTVMPGFGGTSLMFPVLINEGYHRRGLSLSRVAELSSYNPARWHRLFPKKGSISVGADADLAIIDLEAEKEVTTAALHSAQDYTPFEGMKLKGWPETTIVRGRVVFENDQVVGDPGWGRYQHRPAS
ncbi:MAG: dihydroorotase [Desulfobacteraceae bacterium]